MAPISHRTAQVIPREAPGMDAYRGQVEQQSAQRTYDSFQRKNDSYDNAERLWQVRQDKAAIKAKQDAEKEALKESNNLAEARAEGIGMATSKDELGRVQPARNPLTGGVQMKSLTTGKQYNKAGQEYEMERGVDGVMRQKLTDKDADIGPDPDNPKDPNIYRKNKGAPWQGYDPKVGVFSSDPAVKKASQNHIYKTRMEELRDQIGTETALKRPIEEILDSGERRAMFEMGDAYIPSGSPELIAATKEEMARRKNIREMQIELKKLGSLSPDQYGEELRKKATPEERAAIESKDMEDRFSYHAEVEKELTGEQQRLEDMRKALIARRSVPMNKATELPAFERDKGNWEIQKQAWETRKAGLDADLKKESENAAKLNKSVTTPVKPVSDDEMKAIADTPGSLEEYAQLLAPERDALESASASFAEEQKKRMEGVTTEAQKMAYNLWETRNLASLTAKQQQFDVKADALNKAANRRQILQKAAEKDAMDAAVMKDPSLKPMADAIMGEKAKLEETLAAAPEDQKQKIYTDYQKKVTEIQTKAEQPKRDLLGLIEAEMHSGQMLAATEVPGENNPAIIAGEQAAVAKTELMRRAKWDKVPTSERTPAEIEQEKLRRRDVTTVEPSANVTPALRQKWAKLTGLPLDQVNRIVDDAEMSMFKGIYSNALWNKLSGGSYAINPAHIWDDAKMKGEAETLEPSEQAAFNNSLKEARNDKDQLRTVDKALSESFPGSWASFKEKNATGRGLAENIVAFRKQESLDESFWMSLVPGHMGSLSTVWDKVKQGVQSAGSGLLATLAGVSEFTGGPKTEFNEMARMSSERENAAMSGQNSLMSTVTRVGAEMIPFMGAGRVVAGGARFFGVGRGAATAAAEKFTASAGKLTATAPAAMAAEMVALGAPKAMAPALLKAFTAAENGSSKLLMNLATEYGAGVAAQLPMMQRIQLFTAAALPTLGGVQNEASGVYTDAALKEMMSGVDVSKLTPEQLERMKVDARDRGVAKARGVAALSGALVGAVGMAFPAGKEKLFMALTNGRKVGSLTVGEMGQAIGSIGLRDVFKSATFREGMKAFVKLAAQEGKGIAKGTLDDAAEELLEQLPQDIIASMSYNPSMTIEQIVSNALKSAGIGAIMGFGASSSMSAVKALQNAQGRASGDGGTTGGATPTAPDDGPVPSAVEFLDESNAFHESAPTEALVQGMANNQGASPDFANLDAAVSEAQAAFEAAPEDGKDAAAEALLTAQEARREEVNRLAGVNLQVDEGALNASLDEIEAAATGDDPDMQNAARLVEVAIALHAEDGDMSLLNDEDKALLEAPGVNGLPSILEGGDRAIFEQGFLDNVSKQFPASAKRLPASELAQKAVFGGKEAKAGTPKPKAAAKPAAEPKAEAAPVPTPVATPAPEPAPAPEPTPEATPEAALPAPDVQEALKQIGVGAPAIASIEESLSHIRPALKRFAPAFPNQKVKYTMDDLGSGGLAVQNGQLIVSLPNLRKTIKAFKDKPGGIKKWAQLTMREEGIHAIVESAARDGDLDMSALVKALEDEGLKGLVATFRADTPENQAHEFIAALVAERIQLKADGNWVIDGKEIRGEEMNDPQGFYKAALAALKRLRDYFKKLLSGNPSTEAQKVLAEYLALIEARIEAFPDPEAAPKNDRQTTEQAPTNEPPATDRLAGNVAEPAAESRDSPEFQEFQELNLKRQQFRNKVKGVKFSKKDEARFRELAPRVGHLLFETVDPENDPIVGEDINDQPIRQSKGGTFYTVENGRVRTGPAFKDDPEYVREQNEILAKQKPAESPAPAAENTTPTNNEDGQTEEKDGQGQERNEQLPQLTPAPAAGEQSPVAELPAPTDADWRSREKFVGEDFYGTPNSVSIQVRDLDSVPVGDGKATVIPIGKDLQSTMASAHSGFQKLVDSKGGSLRESFAAVLDGEGRMVMTLAYTPQGMEVARKAKAPVAEPSVAKEPLNSDYTFSKSFSNDPDYLAGQRNKWSELFGKPAETVTLADIDRVAVQKEWSNQTKNIYIQERKPLVEAAIREGKPVPAEVLADYPDLVKPSTPEPSVAATKERKAKAMAENKPPRKKKEPKQAEPSEAPTPVTESAPEKQDHELTPNQFSEKKNRAKSEKYNVPLSKVNEDYSVADNAEDHWRLLQKAAEDGKSIPAIVLDNLPEERIEFLRKFHTSSLPEGYFAPSVRQRTKQFKQEMVAARKAGREASATPSNVEKTGQDFQQAAPKKYGKKKIKESDNGIKESLRDGGLLARIAAEGGIVSLSEARRQNGREWTPNGSWDGARDLNTKMQGLWGTGENSTNRYPDQVAESLDMSVDEMWQALHDEADSKKKIAQDDFRDPMEAEGDKLDAQMKRFRVDTSKRTKSADTSVKGRGLNVGDVVEVNGEKLRVESVNEDDGFVTLQDGNMYGEEVVDMDETIWVQKVTKAPSDFTLESPESDQLKQEAERAKTKAKIQERQDKPLVGNAGDMTPDMLDPNADDAPLFMQAKPQTPEQTIIPNSNKLKVTNLDQLPKGRGLRYLEVIEGDNGTYIAKQWRAKPMKGVVLIDFEATKDQAGQTSASKPEGVDVELIKRAALLMRGGMMGRPTFDPWQMAGDRYKDARQSVMTALLGRKATKAESGITAISDKFAEIFGDKSLRSYNLAEAIQQVVEGDSKPIRSAPVAGDDVARHSELEAKHNAGTITPAETAEAQKLVDAAAKAAGALNDAQYLYHGGNKGKTSFAAGSDRGGIGFAYLTDSKNVAWKYAMGGGIDSRKSLAEYRRQQLKQLPDREATVQKLFVLGSALDFSDYKGRPTVDNLMDIFGEERIRATLREYGSDFRQALEDGDSVPDVLSTALTEGGWLQEDTDATASVPELQFVAGAGLLPDYLSHFGKSVVAYNDAEAGGKTYAILDPNQIKSADPFTGTPLDQRFNPESNDIRRSSPAAPAPRRQVYSLTKKAVTEQREDRGMNPVPKGPSISEEQDDAAAKARLDKDELAGEKLTDRIIKGEVEAITSEDNAVLLIHYMRLQGMRNQQYAALTDGKLSKDERDRVTARLMGLESDMDRTELAARQRGTILGRALNSIKRMRQEDASFDGMRRKKEAAIGRKLDRNDPKDKALLDEIKRLTDSHAEKDAVVEKLTGELDKIRGEAGALAALNGKLEDAAKDGEKVDTGWMKKAKAYFQKSVSSAFSGLRSSLGVKRSSPVVSESESMSAEADAQRERDGLVSRIISTLESGKPYVFRGPDGRDFLFTRSSKPDHPFQVTHRDKDGPMADTPVYSLQTLWRDASPEIAEIMAATRPDIPDDTGFNTSYGGRTFLYELRGRPAGPNAVPPGFVKSNKGGRYGIGEFSRILTQEEIESFELKPVGFTDIRRSSPVSDDNMAMAVRAAAALRGTDRVTNVDEMKQAFRDELGDAAATFDGKWDEIWDASDAAIDEMFEEGFGSASPKVKAAVKARVKKTDAPSLQQAHALDQIKQKAGEGSVPDDLNAQIQAMSLAMVRGGIDNVKDLVDAMHIELQKVFPDITREMTMRLLSRYGQRKELDPEPAKATKRQLDAEIRENLKVFGFEQTPPVPAEATGMEMPKPGPVLRVLKKLTQKALEKAESLFPEVFAASSAQNLQSIEDSIKTRLLNEIEELDIANSTMQPLPGKRGKREYSQANKDLLEKRNALRERYDRLFPKGLPDMKQQQASAREARDKRIKELEVELALGKVQGPKIRPVEMTKDDELQASYLETLKQERAANKPMASDAQRQAAWAASLDRSIKRLESDIRDGPSQNVEGKPLAENAEIEAKKKRIKELRESVKKELFPEERENRLEKHIESEIARVTKELNGTAKAKKVKDAVDMSESMKEKLMELEGLKETLAAVKKLAATATEEARIATLERSYEAGVKALEKLKGKPSGTAKPIDPNARMTLAEFNQRKKNRELAKQIKAEKERIAPMMRDAKINAILARKWQQRERVTQQIQAIENARDIYLNAEKSGKPLTSQQKAELAASLRVPKDTSKAEERARLEKQAEVEVASAELAKSRQELINLQHEWEEMSRTFWDKAGKLGADMNRAAVLTGISTIEHLSGGGVSGVAASVARDAATATLRALSLAIPGLKALMDMTTHSGHFSFEATGALFAGTKKAGATTQGGIFRPASWWQAGVKGVLGKSNIDVYDKSGKPGHKGIHKIPSYYTTPQKVKAVVDMILESPGNLHASIKETFRQGHFAKAAVLEWNAAERRGEDTSDAVVMEGVLSRSLAIANREIMMGDNWQTRFLIKAVKLAARSEKVYPALGKIFANLMDFLIPVSNVPSSIVNRIASHIGGVPVGLIKLGHLASQGKLKGLASGKAKITEQEAEWVVEMLRNGMVGLALAAYAWTHAAAFGGAYATGEERRKRGKLKPGEIDLSAVFGMEGENVLNKHLTHDPLLSMMNYTAEMSRVAQSYVDDGDESGAAFVQSMPMFLMMLMEKNPNAAVVKRFMNPFKTGWEKTYETLLTPLSPVGLRQAAEYMDTDEEGEKIVRKQDSPGNFLKSGIPGLRESVPAKQTGRTVAGLANGFKPLPDGSTPGWVEATAAWNRFIDKNDIAKVNGGGLVGDNYRKFIPEPAQSTIPQNKFHDQIQLTKAETSESDRVRKETMNILSAGIKPEFGSKNKDSVLYVDMMRRNYSTAAERGNAAAKGMAAKRLGIPLN